MCQSPAHEGQHLQRTVQASRSGKAASQGTEDMKCHVDSEFITAMLDIRLDHETLVEWQYHSKDKVKEFPQPDKLLDFLEFMANSGAGADLDILFRGVDL